MTRKYIYFDIKHALKTQDLVIRESGGLSGVKNQGCLESVLENIQNEYKDICNIEIDYTLVRGLDYYSGFVFEAISSELGAQDSFLGEVGTTIFH